MTLVAFDSPLWEGTATFSGTARKLIPVLRRIRSSQDWSRADTASDWVQLRQEIIEGSDISPAASLVLPWVIEFARGRTAAELVQPWLVLGEFELGRLMGGHKLEVDLALEEAANIARECRVQGLPRAQAELGTAISLLPRLPDWARVLVLRVVVLGQRYAGCPVCGELLDVECNQSWQFGGVPIDPLSVSPARQQILTMIRQQATIHGASALVSVDGLSGVARCSTCGSENDVIAVLVSPLKAPA